MGGVIYTSYETILIKSCTFSDNAASEGGVIRASLDKILLIENSTFCNNSASKVGGVLSATGKVGSISNVTVVHSAFEGNFATEGGVIYFVSSHVYMYMQDVTILNNVADL